MQKLKMNAYHLAVLVCLVILVIAGSYTVYITYLSPGFLNQNPSQDPGRTLLPIPVKTAPVQPATPAVPVSSPDARSVCDPQAASRVIVPVDTSVPIQDPMPGIRYTLNDSASGRTIVLRKGDVVEINLRFAPGLPFHWIFSVSGCGLEMVNDGNYIGGDDYWNASGHYRARYRAVSPGTTILNGKLVITPDEESGYPRFNLTVIVK